MAADDVVGRELKSLQEALSTARRDREAAAMAAAPATQTSSSTQPGQAAAEEHHEFREQLAELANAVTSFVEDAEKEIAAHPARTVVGALVVGILIGRLLGRGGRLT